MTRLLRIQLYASNNVTREYLWGKNMGGGIGGLLSMRQNGNGYYYLYDGKGNVTSLIDVNQNPVATYAYDPFGVRMKITGTLDQPFQFSTKEYDPETGLSYFGFRFYSPTLGRWMTRDPLGEAGDVNLYRAVGNNPVNFVDPWGFLEEEYDTYIKIGGSASWRNNNPGNLIFSPWSLRHGAICKSSNNKFAKFPAVDVGEQAQKDLLLGKWSDYSVEDMIPKYAPKNDQNNPDEYLSYLKKHGIDINATVSSQIDMLAKWMSRYEGWKEGKIKYK